MEPRHTEWQPFRANRFVQAILLVLVVAVSLPFLLGVAENDPWWSVALGYGVLGLVVVFFLLSGLRTEVHDDRLVVRMKGLRRRTEPWSDVTSVEIIEVRSLREYGGWGIRYGGKDRGWIYNVRGTGAVRITRHDGKILVIGSQAPERMWMAIEEARRAATSKPGPD